MRIDLNGSARIGECAACISLGVPGSTAIEIRHVVPRTDPDCPIPIRDGPVKVALSIASEAAIGISAAGQRINHRDAVGIFGIAGEAICSATGISRPYLTRTRARADFDG